MAVTRTLVGAGKLMDIEVLDHLVVGKVTFVSLKERRLGFEEDVRSNVTVEWNGAGAP